MNRVVGKNVFHVSKVTKGVIGEEEKNKRMKDNKKFLKNNKLMK